MIGKYIKRDGIFCAIRMIFYLVKTKLFFPKSRLIRFPVYIRGSKNVNLGNLLTTGYGLRVDAFGHSREQIVLGDRIEIGDYVHIAAIEKVVIGDDCLIASKVYISDHDHGIYGGEDDHSDACELQKNKKLKSMAVIIGKNVWVGENVMILKGVTIGDNSIIGASSVVNRSVPANVIVAGSPARVVKEYDSVKKKWIKV